MCDTLTVLAAIAPERDRLESAFIDRVDVARKPDDPVALRTVIADCWREAAQTEARWLGQIATSAKTGKTAAHAPASFRRSWARLNHVAGLPRAVPATKDPAP
jgi:hypothetical protein